MSPTDWTPYFSDDYAQARDRFISAANERSAECLSYSIGRDPNLTIDVAILRQATTDRALVISSGLHGVEGFFGSAVQLAWLDRFCIDCADDVNVVLIHAINPFGFARLRRWNEDNVDLNRNFCHDESDYQGSPPSYAHLDPLLNPQSPPSRFEPFVAKAIWKILRMGMPAVKQSVAGGQYDYPQGCFFGGSGPCESTKIVQENYAAWIGDCQNVLHLDLHTGLGQRGDCKLLLEVSQNDSRHDWYTRVLGHDRIEPAPQQAGTGTAYQAKGSLGGWLQSGHSHFPNSDRNLRFALAEFGTYGVLRVLAAIRAENRAHFYGDSRSINRCKAELLECFCPQDPRWRNQVVQTATEIIDQAVRQDWDTS